MENYSLENLNFLETEALVQFLKDCINNHSLSTYNGSTIRLLFLAYMKLQCNIDNYKKAMEYTE